MFSYIYADSRNTRSLSYFIAAKTEGTANQLALDHIRNLALDYDAPNKSQKLKEVMAAVTVKDVSKAIKLWEQFAADELKITVCLHEIKPFELVE